MSFAFDAYVTEILFDGLRCAFILGDGRVCWAGGAEVTAHDGAILCAVAHPSGGGVLTGGDDGLVRWSREGEAETLADLGGRWIDAITASPASGLVAFAAARDLHVRDLADPRFGRVFRHEKSVAGVAFDAKGRRLAAATYGGVALWYSRIAEQKPVMLRWAGSHVGVAFSPDGRFVVSSMQESALHGWRLSDGQDMRMGGYPSKIKSLVFLEDGAWLATSGAGGVVLWPFDGAGGPMGRAAEEIGAEQEALVSRVAATPGGSLIAAGLDNGAVWICDRRTQRLRPVRSGEGAQITALALSTDRLAWGDESGLAGVADIPSLLA
jgi:WD40 repeat protein